ncbi:RCC1 domain-containing protein [Frankia nepalensis]|uniref:Chromosome condensation regulator RCC1 n=1 Tax=Frankia nepalensis TaxID=1836974 RepID=A0A937RI80_9ACTN|nr:hypothetical protein [Frankia nepalensis]MBL7497993.1 hypothetical protein [Frankia nepalensis]MBL7509075.1 hypothetical protein [Frankia nepalensis]MBL7627819.1 hypothetical protein [Frankia nepalensis]
MRADGTVPVRIDGLSGVTRAAGGADFTLVLSTDGGAVGKVLGWGCNALGQLGIGNTQDTATPTAAVGAPDDFVDLDAGNNHALARRPDGTAWSWGSNSSGRLGLGPTAPAFVPVATQIPGLSGVPAMAAGHLFSLAIARPEQVAKPLPNPGSGEPPVDEQAPPSDEPECPLAVPDCDHP